MADKHNKLDRLAIELEATIATLASKTAIQLGTLVVTQNFAAALYQGTIALRAATEGQPLAIYVADAVLTQAEVTEAILGAPLQVRDTPAIEQTRRAVQLIAVVSLSLPKHLDQGNRLPMFREAVGLTFWGFNPMSAAFTTGAIASGVIWAYGRFKD